MNYRKYFKDDCGYPKWLMKCKTCKFYKQVFDVLKLTKTKHKTKKIFTCNNPKGDIGDCKVYEKDDKKIRELLEKKKQTPMEITQIKEKYKGVRNMPIDMPFEKVEVMKEGEHTGEIVEVNDRPPSEKTQYHYIDVVIEENVGKTRAKAGFPARLSEQSGLGKLCKKLNPDMKTGKKYDVEKLLIGKKVKFTCMHGESGFAEVTKETIRLVE